MSGHCHLANYEALHQVSANDVSGSAPAHSIEQFHNCKDIHAPSSISFCALSSHIHTAKSHNTAAFLCSPMCLLFTQVEGI